MIALIELLTVFLMEHVHVFIGEKAGASIGTIKAVLSTKLISVE